MKLYSIDFRLLKDFFRSKLNRRILVFSLIMVLSNLICFLCMPAYQVFPNKNNLGFAFYTDKANGGNSQILQQNISETAIILDFDLKEGFSSPYVGISIRKKDGSMMDLSWYNQVCIDIEGQKIRGIGINLFTANNEAVLNSKDLCFNTKLGISEERKLYRIDMDQLKVPDWWYDMYNIPQNQKISPDLKHVYNLNIGSAYNPIKANKRSLRIHRIWFGRDNTALISFWLLFELFVVFLLVVIHYIRALPTKKTEPIRIEYKSVEMDDEDDSQTPKGFLDFINNNYHESELSLELVSNSTGINQRHITKYIHETFDCNFKTYVNRIRINESKRLLMKTDFNIGEIAFKVGFSNQSHFNRVFKILEGTSPSEFREGKK